MSGRDLMRETFLLYNKQVRLLCLISLSSASVQWETHFAIMATSSLLSKMRIVFSRSELEASMLADPQELPQNFHPPQRLCPLLEV
jgi:hypothetical protein